MEDFDAIKEFKRLLQELIDQTNDTAALLLDAHDDDLVAAREYLEMAVDRFKHYQEVHYGG